MWVLSRPAPPCSPAPVCSPPLVLQHSPALSSTPAQRRIALALRSCAAPASLVHLHGADAHKAAPLRLLRARKLLHPLLVHLLLGREGAEPLTAANAAALASSTADHAQHSVHHNTAQHRGHSMAQHSTACTAAHLDARVVQVGVHKPLSRKGVGPHHVRPHPLGPLAHALAWAQQQGGARQGGSSGLALGRHENRPLI